MLLSLPRCSLSPGYRLPAQRSGGLASAPLPVQPTPAPPRHPRWAPGTRRPWPALLEGLQPSALKPHLQPDSPRHGIAAGACRACKQLLVPGGQRAQLRPTALPPRPCRVRRRPRSARLRMQAFKVKEHKWWEEHTAPNLFHVHGAKDLVQWLVSWVLPATWLPAPLPATAGAGCWPVLGAARRGVHSSRGACPGSMGRKGGGG